MTVMKRVSDADSSTPIKRRCHSSAREDILSSEVIFSDRSRERAAEDVLRDGLDSDCYIYGRVFMKHVPQNGRMWLMLKTSTGLNVGVTFTGKCSQHFNLLACNFHEEVKLRIRGAAKTEPERNASLSLIYEQGAAVMFVKARDHTRDGRVIDTWRLDEDAEQLPLSEVNGNDWYGTPSRPQRRGFNAGPAGPSDPGVNTELTNSSTEENGDTVIAAQDVMSSRLAASTRGFSPSVQLAATRRSASIVPPAVSDANRDVDAEAEYGICYANGARNESSSHPTVNAVSDRLRTRTQPSSTKPTIHKPEESKAVPRRDSSASEAHEGSTSHGPTRHAVNSNQDTEASCSKKSEKARKRKLRQLQRASGGEKPQERASGASMSPKAITDSNKARQVNASTENNSDQTREDVHDSDQTIGIGEMEVGTVARRSKARSTMRLPKPSINPRARSVGQEQVAESFGFPPVRAPSLPEPMAIEPSPKPSLANPPTRVSPETEIADAPQPPQASLRNEYAFYTPLAKVETKDKIYNVAAVVSSIGFVAQTSTGDFKTVLGLTDPSVHELNGFSVNMFAKNAVQLPDPAIGDIILIRGILGDYYRQRCGTAPSYKTWSWAIVNPRTREPAREKGDIAFQPTSSELQHCSRLGEWWSSVSPAQNLGVVHQIRPIRTGRIHRLLSEASPDCEPDGYFDCTIEVLYGHENSNGIYSLYVTDYTQNPDMVPVERDWCPPMLTDKVLKLELFLDAAKKGRELRAGEYYFIGNCRMKRSTGGYLEATFSQVQKMRKLDEDALEDEPRLTALLERKAQWQTKVETSSGAHEFPHLRFEQAEENKHFRCTVELLYISPKDQITWLYATDYTRRDDLAPVAFTVPRAKELQDRVVKIALHDEQAETAKQLEAGDFVAIRNLRLRPSGSEQKLTGRLGGNQRLLNKLQVDSPNNHELKALLMRKAEFTSRQYTQHAEKATADRCKQEKAASLLEISLRQEDTTLTTPFQPAIPADASGHHTAAAEYHSIGQIKASTVCPGKFRVRARIVDFYPPKISAFTIRRCSKCNRITSAVQRTCNFCDDAMDPANRTSLKVYWHFALEVQDDEKECLQIFSSDYQCAILRGLDPENLEDDDDTINELARRLQDFCGELIEVREGEVQRRMHGQQSESPWLSLVLGRYSLEDENNPSAGQYLLMDCSITT